MTADRSDEPLPALLVCLTVVTGLVDAFSYLRLGHVFGANVTGNVVFLGFALAGVGRSQWCEPACGVGFRPWRDGGRAVGFGPSGASRAATGCGHIGSGRPRSLRVPYRKHGRCASFGGAAGVDRIASCGRPAGHICGPSEAGSSGATPVCTARAALRLCSSRLDRGSQASHSAQEVTRAAGPLACSNQSYSYCVADAVV
jgi:hypothetical protein